MKKQLLFSILVTFVISGSSCSIIGGDDHYTKLPDSGKSYKISPFTSIDAQGVFNIILSQGKEAGVTIKGYLPSGLNVYNNGNTLVIKDSLNHHENIKMMTTDIYITITDSTLNISESQVGATRCNDTLKLKKFTFNTEGVGSVNLWTDADSLLLSDDGVGKIELFGRAGYTKIDDNGVSSLDEGSFKADELHANINGVGTANIYAVKELYLVANGIGQVRYGGPAKVMKLENSGVGKVKRVN